MAGLSKEMIYLPGALWHFVNNVSLNSVSLAMTLLAGGVK